MGKVSANYVIFILEIEYIYVIVTDVNLATYLMAFLPTKYHAEPDRHVHVIVYSILLQYVVIFQTE